MRPQILFIKVDMEKIRFRFDVSHFKSSYYICQAILEIFEDIL